MSISGTITALQAKHAAISGITSAPAAMPSSLNGTQLPIALVWPGEATWNFAAAGLKRQERTYIVRCYVQAIGQGFAGPDPGYQACVTLLPLFAAAYQGDITLGGAVDTMTGMEDSGVSGGGFDLLWGQTPYWGFVYRLRIVEKAS